MDARAARRKPLHPAHVMAALVCGKPSGRRRRHSICGCAGQFLVRARCSSTTAHGRPSRGAWALSDSCKPPGIGCVGRATLPGANGWVLAIDDVGAHPPCAPVFRRPPMLARMLDLLPPRGQGAQSLPTKTVRYRGYELTIHAPISGGDRWHVVIRPPDNSPPIAMPIHSSGVEAVAEARAAVDHALQGRRASES